MGVAAAFVKNEVTNMLDAQQVSKEIADKAIDMLGDRINRIILYGSYARGDFTPESDIDIMILLNCEKDEVEVYKKTVNRLASRESLEKDVTISILLRDVGSFESRKEIVAFYKNANDEGIVIYPE